MSAARAKSTNAATTANVSAVEALFAESETVSASALTTALSADAERELSPKTVRAYLRRIQARDQSTLKNQRWAITREVAALAESQFVKRSSADAETA